MPIYNLAYGSQNRPGISGTPQSNSHLLQMTTYRINTPGPTPWTPGADTVLYYDFEHTSGTSETNLAGISSYDGTYQATPTISTLASGKKIFSTNGNNALNTNSTMSTLNYNNITVCVWFKWNSGDLGIFGQDWWGLSGGNGSIFSEHYQGISFALGTGSSYTSGALSISGWANVVITGNGSHTYVYVNGVDRYNHSVSALNSSSRYFHVGGAAVYNAASTATLPSNRISNSDFGIVIIENKVWTNADAQNYFNSTKYDYFDEQKNFTISDIPLGTNIYVNVSQQSIGISKVKFTFNCLLPSSENGWVSICGNNSNTNRYGLILDPSGDIKVRGRLGGSDTIYHTFSGAMTTNGPCVFEVNKDGSCSLTYNNGTPYTRTATGAELNVIQTIMALSNMNVYGSQNSHWFSGDDVDVEVTYS